MEVHHHPDLHHKPKKWKEYFLEFLMIFLAVTLGFFAETIRERITEHSRARELAIAFYEELKSDSASCSTAIMNRKIKEDNLQYLAGYFKDSSLTDLPKEFYIHFFMGAVNTRGTGYEPTDGILQQLTNSGSLRYFSNIDIQKAVGELISAANLLRLRNERELVILGNRNTDFLLKYFDNDWLNRIARDSVYGNGNDINLNVAVTNYGKSNAFIPANILNITQFNRIDAVNFVSFSMMAIKTTRIGQMTSYSAACKNLLSLIKKEYHLENE